MNDRGRLIIGITLILLVAISLNFSYDSFVKSEQSTDFINKISAIPDGSLVVVHLALLYDESIEIEPAFTTLLWYLSRKKMEVVFIPLTIESGFILENSAETVRNFLLEKEAFPEIVSTGSYRASSPNHSWSICNFTPGSLFAMRHFSLDYLGCYNDKIEQLHDLQAVFVVGSVGFDGMPAPMLYTLFGQKAQLHTPLYVISSAQKRPMLEPLVKTGQIRAMISGNYNSLAFAAQLQSPVDYSKKSVAITALIVAVIFLLVGMMINTLFRKKE
ncbi:hypothetical protein KAH37_06955 [bacterium]|nr:hypothetical protein [bacterium]